MSTKDQAVKVAMAKIEEAVLEVLHATLPRVMGELFNAGGAEYAAALQRAMQSVDPLPESSSPAARGATYTSNSAAKPGKGGRAPRGAVRRAVLSALLPTPGGLSTSEVVVKAQEINHSISAGGIQNELNRQKGTIYLNADGRWSVPPELRLGGSYSDLDALRVRTDAKAEGEFE